MLTEAHCGLLCWCADIMEDRTNMSKHFLDHAISIAHEKEVSHRLRKWKVSSRALLENSQKNPRTLNTMHKLLLSRTLSRAGVARVSSPFEDGFPLLVAGRMVKHRLP